MSGAFPDSWYVTPVRFVRVSGGFGDNDRWEAAGDLPKALFAPSTASEDVKLSEAVERVARLYWERQAVHLEEVGFSSEAKLLQNQTVQFHHFDSQ